MTATSLLFEPHSADGELAPPIPFAPDRNEAATRPESPAATRRRAQLPSFAPLLDEIELAGWSSDRERLAGNFHDWLPLAGGGVMVAVGRVLETATTDPVEAALLAQSVWTAVRAHALHATDAGTLLSLVGRTVYSRSTGDPLASLALGIVDPVGGRVDLALAGGCLALRIRAAECESATDGRPPLGLHHDATYVGQQIELRPRERLAVIVGPHAAGAVSAIQRQFTNLEAEAHRRMTAGETVRRIRQGCEAAERTERLASTSILVARRR